VEIAQTYQWLITTMQADPPLVAAATGGIWTGNADVGVIAPYVYVGRQAGNDVLTQNVKRLFANELVLIKAVGPVSNYAALIVIANRIDFWFGRSSLVTLSVGGVLCCYRDGEVDYTELSNGVQYAHLGGLYHVMLQGV
jgi:hypothetical protein